MNEFKLNLSAASKRLPKLGSILNGLYRAMSFIHDAIGMDIRDLHLDSAHRYASGHEKNSENLTTRGDMKVQHQPGSTLLEAKVMAFAGLTLESGHFFFTGRYGGKAEIPTTLLIEAILLLILAFMVEKGARPLSHSLQAMSIYLVAASALFLVGVHPQPFHMICFILSTTGLVFYGRRYGKWAIEERKKEKSRDLLRGMNG